MPLATRLPRLALTALVVISLGSAALASEAHCRVPMADWQPRDAVRALAEAQGLTVRRIKIDDGCYEVDARDAQGHRIELRLNPATLEVLRSGDDEKGDHEDHDD
ncbi:MAG: PepSY domain-containing protein [Paracoccaceae bacterium]|jgi:hypothetical protein|nr:PepSY domain-containing protein [Paracoccaceae bacterium]